MGLPSILLLFVIGVLPFVQGTYSSIEQPWGRGDDQMGDGIYPNDGIIGGQGQGINPIYGSSSVVPTQSLDIFTKNSENVDTWTTKYAYKYYTNLAPCGITPGINDQLEFKVRACADVSVLSSDAPDLNSTDHYDVVLGGFNNGRSEIRKRGIGQITVETPQILNCQKFRKITIRWTVDGVIEVQNSSAVFMRRVEDSKISVLGVGIMTSHGSTGNWTFNTIKRIYCLMFDKDKIENGNKGIQENPWLCDLCICTNQTQTQNYTYTEWREILASQLEQIKDNMKLDKERLSSSIRKRTCASDYRPSAERLGIIGEGVIVVEICIIIFDDLLTLVMRLKHLV